MNWYPSRRTGLLVGLVLLIALGFADCLLVGRIRGSAVDLTLFGRALLLLATLPLGALVVYAYCGLAGLAYHVERNGIVVRWAAHRDVVPVADIVEVAPLTVRSAQLAGGLGWPGYRFGWARLEGVGRVRVYVTRTSGRLLLIRTRGEPLLLSPVDVDGFLADYRARRALGPIAQWTLGVQLPGPLALSIWRDRLALMALVPGLVLNLALIGYLAARYPSLPPRLMLSFDPQGLGDRIAAGQELFLLPAIGLGILLVNLSLAALMHRRERVLARLLAANVPVIQILLWVTVVRLLG